MLDLVRELAALDLRLTHETAELRWGPATTFFALASTWWVKGPLLVGLGGVDLSSLTSRERNQQVLCLLKGARRSAQR